MIKEFLNYIENERGYSHHTIRNYAIDLRDFAGWASANIADARWSAITRADVEQYIWHMAEEEKSGATINRHIASLRSFYDYLVAMRLIDANPTAGVKGRRDVNRETSTIPVSAIRQYVDDETADLETRALVALIADTGLRISEALGLTRANVDARQRVITVTGKGGQQRVTWYGEKTRDLMNRIAKPQRQFFFTMNAREANRAVWTAFHLSTPMGHCSPHIIRHTMATNMLRNGADLASIQHILGHKNLATTERYLHLGTNQLQQTAAKTANILR